ncbi:hypothetical protein ACOMHN_027983 [Nucella lapillus]
MEPSAVGVTVLRLTVTDDDEAGTPSATPTLEVTAGDTGDVFGVQGLNLVLKKEVNFEANSSYSLTLKVKDGGTPPLSSTCRANIVIVSKADHPPMLTLPNYSTTLKEDTAPGTTIYDAEARDLDVGAGSVVTYSLVSGNEAGDFFILPATGEVLIWNPLDYDTLPRLYNLSIEAQDDGGMKDTMWLHVNLTDLNDEVPVFTRNVYGRNLREDVAVGTYVQTVSAKDRDSGVNGAVTYQALSGNGFPLFIVDGVTGRVTTNATLDREQRLQYSLVIEATDGGSPNRTATTLLVVRLVDINDHTPVFSPSVRVTESVSEAATAGTVVTTVTATDGDATAANNVIAYVFLHSHFLFDPATGALTVRQTLDRETTSSYGLRVLAVDNGAPSRTGTAFITVIVDDVNDNTPVITGTYVTSVSENADVNRVVSTITATDADVGDNARLTHAIVGGNTNGDFVISEENGIIQVRLSSSSPAVFLFSLAVFFFSGCLPLLSGCLPLLWLSSLSLSSSSLTVFLFSLAVFLFSGCLPLLSGCLPLLSGCLPLLWLSSSSLTVFLFSLAVFLFSGCLPLL